MAQTPETPPPPALGIDLGGSSAKLALVAGDGTPLATGATETYRRPLHDALKAEVVEALARLLSEVAGGGDAGAGGAIGSVGLAVPGPVEAGRHVVMSGNLPAVNGLDGAAWARGVVRDTAKGVLGESTDVGVLPVTVVTDQLAAAAAQWRLDPLPGRVLYLALGTGVGGALLDDGRPVTFTRGTPGHLGHLDVSGGDPDAPATDAAGRGALEAYLGANQLRAAGLPLDNPAACANHPAMNTPVAALSRGLRLMLALYRMDHVVLMGGVAQAFAQALDRVRSATNDRLTTVAPKAWTLRIGEAGPTAGAVGAAQLAQENNHR